MIEHADQKTRDRIAEALEPPVTFRVNGAPVWYGDDDEAWDSWQTALKR